MLESVIARSIRDQLEEHWLIYDSLHYFTKGRSYLISLLSFYDRVIEAEGRNKDYDIIYFDFSKALGKVRYQSLLKKVMARGIDVESVELDRDVA